MPARDPELTKLLVQELGRHLGTLDDGDLEVTRRAVHALKGSAGLAGEPELVHTPSASGIGQRIARCPACRLAVWSHYGGAGERIAFVRVGTLDDPDACPPDIHIFTMSKQPWVILPGGVPTMREYYDRETCWPKESLARRAAVLAETSR